MVKIKEENMEEIKKGTKEENGKWLAHISEDRERTQTLLAHLQGTAELARLFAEKFGAGEYAYLSGLLHDIGKYCIKFQRRLQGQNVQVDHSTAGAKVLKNKGIPIYWLLAVGIAGHHGGLPDWGSVGSTQGDASMEGRLKKELEDFSAWEEEVTPVYPTVIPCICEDAARGRKPEEANFSLAFFARMVFSCLVDADYLDTERFMKNETYLIRKNSDTMKSLWSKAETYLNEFQKKIPESQMKQIRNQIFKDCMLAAERPAGMFRLTVPTGGGKTLSSIAFALKHASIHEMERIVYIVPYTSIIEQNADVFRTMLGAENVLEHHSNAEYESLEETCEGLDEKLRLASENWDIPVVVTTSVQFFESLYGNKASKCRKLHNLAKSVLVFDEAQMIPCDYLLPCVRAIKELVVHYHCTAVLCTATQPSLEKYFEEQVCTEICSNPKELYLKLRRTSFVNAGVLSQESLSEQLMEQKQVLCIVNNRERAQELFEGMEKEGSFHLSTRLYPEHRKKILEEIKERLKAKKPCRVVATSLVEAGVDLDFPCVYRELAGLDSMIQAAGRCNREGEKSMEESQVYLFEFPAEDRLKNPSSLKIPISISRELLEKFEDIGSPEVIKEYFDHLYNLENDRLDKKDILGKIEETKKLHFPFRTIAKEFRLIETQTRDVLITREKTAEDFAQRLKNGERSRELLREIGRYSVQVSCAGQDERQEREFERMRGAGMIEELDEEVAILRNLEKYDEKKGLFICSGGGDGIFI